MKRTNSYGIANLIVLMATIYWNYLSNTGIINGETMGSLSNKYDTLFTPAGYAFSIWGFIYIGLLGNAIYLLRNASSPYSKPQALSLMVANLANCLWIYCWLNEYTLASVIVMVVLLLTLLWLVIRLGIGQKKHAIWVWWPISIYSGWIVVALVANISAYLTKIQWTFLMESSYWAVLLIIVATSIYIFLSVKKHLTYMSYVGVWALFNIMIKQWDITPTVQYSALACFLCLFAITIIKDYQARRKGIY